MLQNIDLQESAICLLRLSLDMWCSQKQRLQSVSSGKEVSSCAELLASEFRFDCGLSLKTPIEIKAGPKIVTPR